MCFNKQTLKYIFIPGGAFCFAMNVFAQQADTVLYDLNYIKNSNVWLGSKNAAGLQFVPVKKVSTATLGFQKSDGGFKNYSQSDNSYQWGANTESFYRLNKNVMLYGLVNYDNYKGKDMQGSALVDPSKHPLSFEDNADTTFGDKKLEQYHLTGGVSAQLSKRFILGGNVNYKAGDYAKLKDLRYQNRLFDLEASLGGLYKVSNSMELGINYSYNKRVESLKFEIHGNTDKQYLVFINYGDFYGTTELFGEEGYTKDKRPFVNNTNEISLQANIKISPEVEFLNEFSFGTGKGYFGKKGTTAIMFTEHDANNYGYTGTLQLRKPGNLHQFKLNGTYKSLINNLNVYRRETTTGGVSTIVYYGQNEVFTQDLTNASLGYWGYLGLINNIAQWVINSSIDYTNRNQKTTIYPFYRKQDLSFWKIDGMATRNIIQADHMWSFSFGLAAASGSGGRYTDALYQTPSADQRAPASRETYLNQEYEFLTKPRVTVEPAIQYSKLVNNNMAAYIKLGTRYTRAFDVSYLGRSYNNASLSIGCFF